MFVFVSFIEKLQYESAGNEMSGDEKGRCILFA